MFLHSKHLRIAFLIGCSLTLAAGHALAVSCGPAPKAKPHRWTGGESFPPLPLPATPLRRSEKKRPPAPPALIGKIQYGKMVIGVDEKGQKYTFRAWTHAVGDMNGLLRQVNRSLGLRYRGVELKLATFSFSPREIPVLYLSGREKFEFTPELRAKLRWYLQDGGTLLANASSGSEEYVKAFVKEINTIFPKKKMRILEEDHPVYSCYHRLRAVEQRNKTGEYFTGPVMLMGINIGARTAVLFSPYDVACAWDSHTHDEGRRVWSRRHGSRDALRIGTNLITYALAEHKLGRHLASEKVYFEQEKPAGDSLVFAQVMHGGDWDPTPGGAMNLFRYATANSTLGVKFRKQPVDLGKAEAFSHPILYMTGLHDFQLSEVETRTLRGYLRGGGLLVADSSCGRKAFDAAFRREMKKVLPGAKFEPLPADSPVYSAAGEPMKEVLYSPMLRKNRPELTAPSLEGVTVGGKLTVIYSRYGLGDGWQGEHCPYALCYEGRDALKLGLNILVYAMSH
ncbi:MAG: DUF4159 domain-containing protein [Planctomycetota bacterium]|jgi:hypothetical protein